MSKTTVVPPICAKCGKEIVDGISIYRGGVVTHAKCFDFGPPIDLRGAPTREEFEELKARVTKLEERLYEEFGWAP